MNAAHDETPISGAPLSALMFREPRTWLNDCWGHRSTCQFSAKRGFRQNTNQSGARTDPWRTSSVLEFELGHRHLDEIERLARLVRDLNENNLAIVADYRPDSTGRPAVDRLAEPDDGVF
jgi:hypothetical protein